MNQDQQLKTASERRRSLIVPCLWMLLLGFALGAIFAAHYRPNYITFEVEPGTPRIHIAPRAHDVINWRLQTNSPEEKPTPVLVKFINGSPCAITAPGSTTTPLSTCEIVKKTGRFEYNCVDADPPKNIICLDPGVDPQSGTGGDQLDLNVFRKLFQSVEVALGLNFFAGPGGAVQVIKATDTPTPPPSTKSPAATLYPGISCSNDASALAVTPDALTDPGHALTVWPGQKIYWQPGELSNFTVTFNPADSICTEGSVFNGSAANPQCTVAKTPPYDVTYAVSTTDTKACKTTTASGYLHIVTK